MDISMVNILHGTMDIANQMYTIAEELKKRTNLTSTLNYYPNYLDYNKADYILDINRFSNIDEANYFYKHFMNRFIYYYDIFHFHFGTSLTLDKTDLPLLKKMEKKVFMQHWGSDVRILSEAQRINPYAKVKVNLENEIKNNLRFISTYVKNCIVSDYELYEYVKNYYENIYIVKQAINLENYQITNKESINKNRFTIIHAPTSPEIKGTKYIINALDSLKSSYDFNFILVQGMTHSEAKKIYEKADLIIDQLHGGSYGLFAIESMALGKPVVCWICDFMKEKYPEDLPIISANPDNIKETIKFILDNKDMLNEIGIKSRKYVEKYHDIKKVVLELLAIYQK